MTWIRRQLLSEYRCSIVYSYCTNAEAASAGRASTSCGSISQTYYSLLGAGGVRVGGEQEVCRRSFCDACALEDGVHNRGEHDQKQITHDDAENLMPI